MRQQTRRQKYELFDDVFRPFAAAEIDPILNGPADGANLRMLQLAFKN